MYLCHVTISLFYFISGIVLISHVTSVIVPYINMVKRSMFLSKILTDSEEDGKKRQQENNFLIHLAVS